VGTDAAGDREAVRLAGIAKLLACQGPKLGGDSEVSDSGLKVDLGLLVEAGEVEVVHGGGGWGVS
jgi:hypothetical protein